MADPLSISSGIVGFLSFVIQVVEKLVQYYTAYKNQDNEIGRTRQKLGNLLNTFKSIETELQKRVFDSDEKNLIKTLKNLSTAAMKLFKNFKKN